MNNTRVRLADQEGWWNPYPTYGNFRSPSSTFSEKNPRRGFRQERTSKHRRQK